MQIYSFNFDIVSRGPALWLNFDDCRPKNSFVPQFLDRKTRINLVFQRVVNYCQRAYQNQRQTRESLEREPLDQPHGNNGEQ